MIKIAGGVVWNPKLGVVVVNQNHNSWSLPKGHVEAGEDHLAAAIREIEEETGISKEALQFIAPLGTYRRTRTKRDPSDPDEMRAITLFLFQTNEAELSPQDPENPEARFMTIDAVSDMLTHPEDKLFFDSIKHHIHL